MLGWPLFRVDLLATTQLVSTHLACDVSGKAIDTSFAVFSYQSKGSLLRGCWKRPIFGVPIASVSVKSDSTFDSQLRVNAFLSKRKKLAPLVHYLFLDNFFISWNPTLLSNFFGLLLVQLCQIGNKQKYVESSSSIKHCSILFYICGFCGFIPPNVHIWEEGASVS